MPRICLRRLTFALVSGMLASGLGACREKGAAPAEGGPQELRIAIVVNAPSDFWKIADAGARKAQAECKVQYEMRIPPNANPAEQKSIVDDLIARGINGMSISAIVPETQTDLINQAAKAMKVVTTDSDAPKSNRICFIGTNNYKAGLQAGQALKEALPEGGKVWLFVGKADSQNAADRKRGIVDAVKDTKIVIADTRTDDADRSRARANVEDVIAANSDVAGLVGLWSYNGPAILEAVKTARKTGKIKIVAFDEEDGTLQGVKDGHIYATVVQQPYEFGYRSVRVLTDLIRGNNSVVPESRIIEVPTQTIRKDGVAAFWAHLRTLLGKS
jgi:ribose transport system substrate-binding protein